TRECERLCTEEIILAEFMNLSEEDVAASPHFAVSMSETFSPSRISQNFASEIFSPFLDIAID
ncbi:hypothetical protein A2U01_0096643, partial [Trifolium medium]|nr:hypothetical protein [Trifolium medium]